MRGGRPEPTPAGLAECIEVRPIVPGQWLARFAVPWPVGRLRAGQLVHLGPEGVPGAVLREAWPAAGIEPREGVVTLYLDDGATEGRPADWPATLRVGDRVGMAGPYGRPFEVDPRSRHLLLVGTGRLSGALRFLMDEALTAGRKVTLLLGVLDARTVFPSSLLPDAVEYVVATADGSLGRPGTVDELLLEFEAWADQAFAAGPFPALAALARVAAGRRERLGVARLGRKRASSRAPQPGSSAARRRAFLQVALPVGPVCALGICQGCVREYVAGGIRLCREGPVVAAEELRWPEVAA